VMNMSELMSVGFVFSEDLKNVLLLRKARPAWQSGLLNGIGGHCEHDDLTFASTMRRECFEEAGLDIPVDKWVMFAQLYDFNEGDWMVVAFCAIAPYLDLEHAVKFTKDKDERIEIISVDSLQVQDRILSNARWLVPMAIDKLSNPRTFKMGDIRY